MEEASLNFILNGNKIKIKGNKKERLQQIFKKFLSEVNKKQQCIDFFHEGDLINNDLKLEDINNSDDEITIIVKEKNTNNSIPRIKEIKYSKDIICPVCKKSCIISFNNYKLNLNKCEYIFHHIDNIPLNEFNKTQIIGEKKKCNNCQNQNIILNNNNKFYSCLTCNMILCPFCKSNHDENHIIVDQGAVNYKCKNHGEVYISYCQICAKNLCILCEKSHNKEHRIIDYRKLIYNDDVSKKLNELREKIDKFNKEIKLIIDKLNCVINNMEIYYEINNDIFNSYKKTKKNYQTYINVQNINESNKLVIKDIDQIINLNNEAKKFEYINKIYYKMNKKNELKRTKTKIFNEIKGIKSNINKENKKLKITKTIRKTGKYEKKPNDIKIKYKIPKNSDKIMIFGNEFIKNNKKKCEIYINGKYHEIMQNIDLSKCQIENDILEVILRPIEKITNMGHMFSGCISLYSISDISKFDTNNVTEMNNLFNMCESLSYLSDISKWNISKVTNISYMFNGCKTLSSLPDISKWNTINVVEMRNIFCGCKALKSLPDISKWNISKVNNLSYLFNECSSLKSLPDISNWDLQEVTDINHMFNNCINLVSLPDLSSWNTSKINNLIYLFCSCKSLINLPDISKWDTSNVNNLICIFASCEALEELPDISNWNTTNVIDMSQAFYNCYNLLSLPDISKWNTENVTNMNYMFYYCQSLEQIPDISKWDISNVTDLSKMFCGCDSLKIFPNISNWNVKKVTNMSYMFANCYSLKTLPDISKWNISKNINSEKMFYFSTKNINPDLKEEDIGCFVF